MKKIIGLLLLCSLLSFMGCTSTRNKDKTTGTSQTGNSSTNENNMNDNREETNGETTSMENTTTILLDTNTKYQTLESFGTSGCWWSQYVVGWDNEYKSTGHSVRDEIAMLLFDQEYGIGLTCYRYNVGAGSKESGNGTYYDYHRRAESFETAPFTYDWSRDANAVWFMKKATELGVKEVVMFCNSPLERLTVNGKAQMDKGSKVNILPDNYDDFAKYVLDVAEHFKEEGVPVKFISPINEPQWDWTESQEGCHYEPSAIAGVYRAFLEELNKRPALSGVSLSGPESGEWKGQATAYTSALLNDSILGSYFTEIDNHSYWSDTASKEAFKTWMDAHYPNVKLRMSEWCEMVNGSDVTMDSAFHLAEVLQEDLTVLNVVSWQNWVGVAPGGYRDGLIYVNEQQKKMNPLKRLWGYGNYSKFIRPGYERIDAAGVSQDGKDLKPVAFAGKNDAGEEELVLVLINEAEENKKILLDFTNGDQYNNLKIYETSEENDLTCVKEEAYKAGNVIDVAQQSITTIILSKAGE